MAIPILNHLDLRSVSELQNAILHKTTTGSASDVEGKIIYDTGSSSPKVYDGSSWIDLGGDIRQVKVTDDGGVAYDVTAGNFDLVISGDTGITTAFVRAGDPLALTTPYTLKIDLDDTSVTAGSYGSSTAIPTFTVDAQGRLTAAGSATVATSLTVDSDGSESSDTADVDLLTDDLKIIGTSNEIETQVSKSGTDVSLQIGLPSDVTIGNDLTVTNDALISSNLTVTGNFTVNGTTTNIDTTNLVIEDNIVLFNKNQTGTPATTLVSGIEVERGSEDNVQLSFKEDGDRWQFTNDGSTFYNIPIPSEYDNFSFSVNALNGGGQSTTQEVANGGTLQFQAGVVDGTNGIQVIISGDDTITVKHANTSSATSVDNSGLNVIQDVTVDTYGHITALASVDLESGIDGRITNRQFSTTIGNASATAISLKNSGASGADKNHGLGTDSTQFMIQLIEVDTGLTVMADVARAASGQVDITFASAPGTDKIRVLINKIG
jgi:hypothetical protein